MNSFKLFSLTLVALMLVLTSCGDDEPDMMIDRCSLVNCPAGYDCNNGDCILQGFASEVVTGKISANTTWTADKVYELAGKVIVESGVTLTIMPGTIVKGRAGTGSLATALIVAQGAKIMAEGTADAPIIFTSVLDNIEPGQMTGTSLSELDNEKWGGLIILGNAPISAEEGDTRALIEGIPADDGFGAYGGDNPADNSGVIKYVSVRHGGAEIGEGNEINGITFGGVGNGTVVENIEVVGNLDDGLEFFGGTVNVTNAIVYFVGDDAIDIDQNYSGTIDNFIIVQGDGVGTDEALEIDGPEGSANDGFFTLKNGTVISVDGVGNGVDLKSKAQGTITSTVWSGYNDDFMKVRAGYNSDCSTKSDAYSNIVEGRLVIMGNEIVTANATDVVNVYSSKDNCEVNTEVQTIANDYLKSNNAFVNESSMGADFSAFSTWSWAGLNNKL